MNVMRQAGLLKRSGLGIATGLALVVVFVLILMERGPTRSTDIGPPDYVPFTQEWTIEQSELGTLHGTLMWDGCGRWLYQERGAAGDVLGESHGRPATESDAGCNIPGVWFRPIDSFRGNPGPGYETLGAFEFAFTYTRHCSEIASPLRIPLPGFCSGPDDTFEDRVVVEFDPGTRIPMRYSQFLDGVLVSERRATSLALLEPGEVRVRPTSTTPATPSPDPVPSGESLHWGEPDSGLPVLTLEQHQELPRSPDEVVRLPDDGSPFPDPGWQMPETLLYDFETGEVEILGPSHWGGGRFSPDGRYLFWVTPPRLGRYALHVRDIVTGTERTTEVLRPLPYLVTEREVLFGEQLVDFETATVRVVTPLPDDVGLRYESGLFLRSHFVGEQPTYTRQWLVSRSIEGRPLLAVEAWLADIVDAQTLVVMTAPVDGIASLHLVDVDTREVTFVATARQQFPGDLEADGRYVAWVENACQYDGAQGFLGELRVWDRATGMITAFEGEEWVADVREGRIAFGAFGPRAWYDISTASLIAAAPTSGELAGWSPDLRYASVGNLLGHGGRCPNE